MTRRGIEMARARVVKLRMIVEAGKDSRP